MKHLFFLFTVTGFALVSSGMTQVGSAAENSSRSALFFKAGALYQQALPPEAQSSFIEEKIVERPLFIEIDPIITGS